MLLFFSFYLNTNLYNIIFVFLRVYCIFIFFFKTLFFFLYSPFFRLQLLVILFFFFLEIQYITKIFGFLFYIRFWS
ncbi:hypothetical protein H8356DRAFT_1666876 [Neocallimastix lanati (nom. inval.)]|nr:hypothetical protein H8356DRAFT_1666876 [Neocallimastix sp. JGI-2020a]